MAEYDDRDWTEDVGYIIRVDGEPAEIGMIVDEDAKRLIA